MAAASADRRKLAVLGVRRGDWLCIGTSFDALGAGGASPPPAPTFQNLVLAPCAGLTWSSPSCWFEGWSASSAALVRHSGTLGSRGLLSH